MIFKLALIAFLSLFLSPVRAQHPQGQDTLLAAHHMIEDSIRYRMEEERKSIAARMAKAEIISFINRVPNEKFGYSIFIDGQLYIEQKSIPSVEGNDGFSTKEHAELVAKLVISKIRQGEMPPSVTRGELEELGIQHQ